LRDDLAHGEIKGEKGVAQGWLAALDRISRFVHRLMPPKLRALHGLFSATNRISYGPLPVLLLASEKGNTYTKALKHNNLKAADTKGLITKLSTGTDFAEIMPI